MTVQTHRKIQIQYLQVSILVKQVSAGGADPSPLDHLILVPGGVDTVIKAAISMATRCERLVVAGVGASHRLMVVPGTGVVMVVHRERRMVGRVDVTRSGKAHIVLVRHGMCHGTGRGKIVHVAVVAIWRCVTVRLRPGVARPPVVAAHRHLGHL